MTRIPPDDVLESLDKLRKRESAQLKTVLELYDMEIHQKISMPNDQKLQIRSYDYETLMPEMIEFEAVAVVTNRRGHRGVERGQGECCQWKAKGQCSGGDQCSFRHDGDERAKSTPKNAPSSEPPTQRGRDASRKRKFRGRSLSGKSNRQPWRDLLKGICTKVPCGNWHPPDVNFLSLNRFVNSAKSARFRTGRLRNNRIEGPRRVVTNVQ